jgi:hypothetical protein
LNSFVFIIPADAGEKTGYTVSIFLSFIVFLTMIKDELPVTSDKISIMSIYVMVHISLSVLVIFITSLQLRLHHRKEETEISGLYRSLVRIERRIRCVDKGSSSMRICCRKHVRTIRVAVKRRSTISFKNDLPSEIEEVMEWADVSSAIDFFSFWFLVMAEVTISTIMFSYSVSH